MSDTLTSDKIPDLSFLGNVVPEGYKYYKKKITPDQSLSLPGAYLKWYNLYPDTAEISKDQVRECKEFLISECEAGKLHVHDELGYVILHRAGDYLLLLVTTWREINEMWESIYVKHAASPDSYAPLHFETSHKGTYCVWELGIVWHERDAWVNFLKSKRDDEAKLAYINDTFSGEI